MKMSILRGWDVRDTETLGCMVSETNIAIKDGPESNLNHSGSVWHQNTCFSCFIPLPMRQAQYSFFSYLMGGKKDTQK